MEIKTKFDIGDKVWVLKDGKDKELEIKSIIIGNGDVWYDNSEAYLVFQPHKEEQCFATKDELIAYIKSDD